MNEQPWWKDDLQLMLRSFSHGDAESGSKTFLLIVAESARRERAKTIEEVEKIVIVLTQNNVVGRNIILSALSKLKE